MSATALLEMLRGQGWRFAADGNGVKIRRPRGALTDELRQALMAEKGAIMAILAAEQARATMPSQEPHVVAVKVWSEVLQEAVWVVADGVPLGEYPGGGKVFTHHEVRVLLGQGRGVKAWAPLDIDVEG